MRQTISPTTEAFVIQSDWPMSFVDASQDGTVSISLPLLDASNLNRPTSVAVVFYPTSAPANPTADQALAFPNASALVPPQSPLQSGATVVTVRVPGVSAGNYTLLIVGTYAS